MSHVGTHPLMQAPISRNCYLRVEACEREIARFLKPLSTLSSHYIQPIHSITYVSGDRVAITQPFRERGSLRDLIHGEVRGGILQCGGVVTSIFPPPPQPTPAVDWAEKYLKSGSPLPPEKVALYGGQILKVSRSEVKWKWACLVDVMNLPLSGHDIPTQKEF